MTVAEPKSSQLGDFVRDKRVELGMTQIELAAKAGIGQQTLSVIETGDHPGTIYVRQRLAAALGMSLFEITVAAGDLHEQLADAALILDVSPERLVECAGMPKP